MSHDTPSTRFRKKPVVIEAVRWNGDNLREVIDFTGRHESADAWTWEFFEEVVRTNGLKIFTLEGSHMATVGDYIIKGVKGECYPCKPDIFAMTYEPEFASPEIAPSTDRNAILEEARCAYLAHYHAASEGNIDKCRECGLDIRDPVHFRANESKQGRLNALKNSVPTEESEWPENKCGGPDNFCHVAEARGAHYRCPDKCAYEDKP